MDEIIEILLFILPHRFQFDRVRYFVQISSLEELFLSVSCQIKGQVRLHLNSQSLTITPQVKVHLT